MKVEKEKHYSLREIVMQGLLYSPITKKPFKSIISVRSRVRGCGYMTPEQDDVRNILTYKIKGEDIIKLNELAK
jgi:hypothetical protein